MSQTPSLISYAQNFEDVMLWRALRHVAPGRFVDVGAQDPTVDSVSRMFTDLGWTGVHVEPHPDYAQALREVHPGDVVIQAAVGVQRGVQEFFRIDGTGISTLVPDIASKHEMHGRKVIQIQTPVITLDDVFLSAGQEDVHWLKIDVEGFESQVLAGWISASTRPWVVVVESTLPMTQTFVFDSWEPLLVAKGYAFVYGDGLNRFYVSDQHPELVASFSAPPNVFDGFSISGYASSSLHLEVALRFEREAERLKGEHLACVEALQASLEEASAQHARDVAAQVASEALWAERLKLGAQEVHRSLSDIKRDADKVNAELMSRMALLSAEIAGRASELERQEQRHRSEIEGLRAVANARLASAETATLETRERIQHLQEQLTHAQAQGQLNLEEVRAAWQRDVGERTAAWEREAADWRSRLSRAEAALVAGDVERVAMQKAHAQQLAALAEINRSAEKAHGQREQRLLERIAVHEAHLLQATEALELLKGAHRSEVAALTAEWESTLTAYLAEGDERRQLVARQHLDRERRLLDLFDQSESRSRLSQDQAIQRESALTHQVEAHQRDRELVARVHAQSLSALRDAVAELEAQGQAARAASSSEIDGLRVALQQERSATELLIHATADQHRQEVAALHEANAGLAQEWKAARAELLVRLESQSRQQAAGLQMLLKEAEAVSGRFSGLRQHWLVRMLGLSTVKP